MKKSAITLLITLSLLAFAMTATVFAYFSLTDEGFFGVKIELLFDKLDATVAPSNIKYEGFDPTAPWGTKANPYVISNENHLMNLSSLQNRDYFKDDASADYPYFLVSDTLGNPTCIDGRGQYIEPIGTSAHPFTGTLSGASGAEFPVVGAITATTSCIYDFKVRSVSGDPDVGLFGNAGYVQTGTGSVEGEIVGYAARISDLLLTDVTVEANDTVGDLQKWWDDFFTKLAHSFTFTDPASTEPHETHHIGIVCGHAEYATFENISVFYSSDTVTALDISADAPDTFSNYYTSTGLVGYMQYMNPDITAGADGKITITAGTGTSNGDLSHTGSGGGGGEAGTHTGFFFADELFGKYAAAGSVSQTLYNASAGGEALTSSIEMPVNWSLLGGYTYKTMYYLTDGVFTMALSNKPEEDLVKKIWQDDPREEERVPTIFLDKRENFTWDTVDNSYPYYTDLKPVTGLTGLAGLTGGKQYNYVIGAATTDEAAGKTTFHVINATGNGKGVANGGQNTYTYTVTGDTTGGDFDAGGGKFVDGAKNERDITNLGLYRDGSVLKTQSQSGFDGTRRLGIYTYYDTPSTYSLYNGADSTGIFNRSAYSYDWLFEAAAGSSYIMYMNAAFKTNVIGIGTTTKPLYVTYDDNFSYSLTENKNEAKPVYVCSASEPYPGDNIPYGWVASADAVTAKADTHVLYAESEYRYDAAATGTTETNNIYTTAASVNDGYYGYGDSSCYARLSYDLRTVESLGFPASPNDETAPDKILTQINTQISMKEAIGDATVTTIGNSYKVTSGLVTAPVGGGTYDIPSGAIAFEINKTDKDGYAYVNVIAAMSAGSTYNNASIGIWENFRTSTGWWTSDKFAADTPAYAFPLPTSALPKDSTAAGNDGDKTTYFYNVSHTTYADENDTTGTKEEYVARFQGDVVLVAHTFKIKAAKGDVFLIASTNGPLNICYFSVTGVASSGGIGSFGSEIGTIDFVYVYNGSIVTVDKYVAGSSAYSDYHYGSVFLYTDPELAQNADGTWNNVNKESVRIYRYYDDSGGKTVTKIVFAGDGYVKYNVSDPTHGDNVETGL